MIVASLWQSADHGRQAGDNANQANCPQESSSLFAKPCANVIEAWED